MESKLPVTATGEKGNANFKIGRITYPRLPFQKLKRWLKPTRKYIALITADGS